MSDKIDSNGLDGLPKGCPGNHSSCDAGVPAEGQVLSATSVLTSEQERNLDMVIAQGAAGHSHLDDRRYAAAMPNFRQSAKPSAEPGVRVGKGSWVK